MDPISMIVTAGVAAVSATSGYIAGRRRRQREDRGPDCEGCDHNFSFHEEGGVCMRQVERTLYGVAGSKLGTRWVRCDCRQYTGPIPADRILSTFTHDLPPLSAPPTNPDGDAPEGR